MRSLIMGAACVAALGLSGCASLGDSGTATQVLNNLEHCDRTYIGAVGGLMPGQLSVTITCHAKPFDAPAKESAS